MTNHIEKTIDLNAPIERVWRALTDSTEFGAWFGAKMHAPFAAGAPAFGQMSFRDRDFTMELQIVAMEEPSLFSYRWHPYAVDPDKDYSGEVPTLVEFRLAPIDTGTRLTVTETGFENLPADRLPDALVMNTAGWGKQLENVRDYVGG
ncbi:SRPBCC family protein [soil metagenome]